MRQAWRQPGRRKEPNRPGIDPRRGGHWWHGPRRQSEEPESRARAPRPPSCFGTQEKGGQGDQRSGNAAQLPQRGEQPKAGESLVIRHKEGGVTDDGGARAERYRTPSFSQYVRQRASHLEAIALDDVHRVIDADPEGDRQHDEVEEVNANPKGGSDSDQP